MHSQTMRPILLACLTIAGASPAWALPNLIAGKALNGSQEVRVDLKDGKGPSVLVFVSSQCPCSISHEAALKALASEFKEARFVAIHSNLDEERAASAAHFAGAGWPFPVIQDDGARLASDLDALKTPHAFVFDRQGELVFQGGVDDSHDADRAKRHYLKEALAALRQGRKPELSRARALGCVIRRK